LWRVIRRSRVVPAKGQGHQGEERIEKRILRTTQRLLWAPAGFGIPVVPRVIL
jgi:hypothetical protein